MKKEFYKIFLSLFLLFCFFVPGLVLAGNLSNAFGEDGVLGQVAGNQGAGYDTTDSGAKLTNIIALAIKTALSLLGVIFLILIIYGGYTWMLARGNEQEATKAKDIITRSVIGLMIVLAAYAVTFYVVENLSSGIFTG